MAQKTKLLTYSVLYLVLSIFTCLLTLWWCQVTAWALEGNYPETGIVTGFFLLCSLLSYIVYVMQFQSNFTEYLDVREAEK